MKSSFFDPFRSPLCLLFFLFYLIAPDLRTSAAQQTQSEGPVLELAFEQVLDSVVIPIRVNDCRTVSCILDTGMPEGLFLMRTDTAQECNLSYSLIANVQGAGAGSQLADVDLKAKLQLASLEWERQRVIVLQAPGRMAHIGVDGAFGQTVFKDHVVQLDFEKNRLSLYEPGQMTGRDFGPPIMATIRNTKLFITATIVNDKKSNEVELLVDTGANKGLSINPSAIENFSPPNPVISTYLGAGVGGDIKGSIGRIDSLKIGDHVLNNVATAFPESRGVDGDGTIGMELLRKFLVTIDYPGERIFLKPNRGFKQPTEFTMTGLAIAPDDEGRLLVRDVLPNSPAFDANINQGDIVLEINSQQLSFAAFSKNRFDQPGENVKMLIERNGEKISKSLILRRLR